MGEVMSSSITLRIIGPSELEGDLTLGGSAGGLDPNQTLT